LWQECLLLQLCTLDCPVSFSGSYNRQPFVIAQSFRHEAREGIQFRISFFSSRSCVDAVRGRSPIFRLWFFSSLRDHSSLFGWLDRLRENDDSFLSHALWICPSAAKLVFLRWATPVVLAGLRASFVSAHSFSCFTIVTVKHWATSFVSRYFPKFSFLSHSFH